MSNATLRPSPYDRWGELPLLLVLVGAAWRRWG